LGKCISVVEPRQLPIAYTNRRELNIIFTALSKNQGNYVQIGQMQPPILPVLFLVLAVLLLFLVVIIAQQC
jgi:hypothetical protein